MKNNLLISVLLSSTLTIIGMDTQSPFPLFDLPHEMLETVVAVSDGETKNTFAKTCKALHMLLGQQKEILLKHPLIHLGPIEKHLLLLEYVETGNADMAKRMFALGATQDIRRVFGEWREPLPRSGPILSGGYVPYLQSFPIKRIPHACIDKQRTLLHVAVVQKQHIIAQILLDQAPAFINTQDSQGNTALHFAVTNNNIASARLLLIHPASNPLTSLICNDLLLSPLSLALSYKFTQMTELLCKHDELEQD